MMKTIDNRDFVVTWTRAQSIDDVMRGMNLTRQQAQSKATYLRKYGVKLKKFSGRKILTEFEVAQLNSLINKTAKG